MPGTTVYPKSKTTPETRLNPGWKVVIFNDDVTPIDLVVLGIQQAAGLSLEVAEMIAVEAHTSGSAIVKQGLAADAAEGICIVLRRVTSLDGQLPGVHCEAQRDD